MSFSIAIDINFGLPGFGSTAGIGIVFKEGTHVFTEIGESSYAGAEATFGLDFQIDWDTETLSDFEGDDIEVGLTFSNLYGASIALSIEPGEGYLGLGEITGITISPEVEFGLSGFWNISWIDIIN